MSLYFSKRLVYSSSKFDITNTAFRQPKHRCCQRSIYWAVGASPNRKTKKSPATIEDSPVNPDEIPLSFCELLLALVPLACGSYASFTILNISFRTVLPVHLATSINMGGLGLDPPAIGTILALMEVLGGILQLLFFAPLHNWLGGKALFLATISLFIPIAALFPTTNHVTQVYGMTHFAWFLVVLQIFFLTCTSLTISKLSLVSWPSTEWFKPHYVFRCHLHLHQCFCAESRFRWSNHWPLAVARVCYVRSWPVSH